MAPNNVFTAIICAVLLACNSASAADAYRAGKFLGLDLSQAVLSPKPLGPSSGFTPVPARTEAGRGSVDVQARLEKKVESGTAVRKAVAPMRATKARGPVRTKLARRHTNPLDAEAFDTRVQVWPCRSGGICGWR